MWRLYLRSRRLHLAGIGWLVTVAASFWWGDHALAIPTVGLNVREMVLAVLVLPLPAVAGALATLDDDMGMWEQHAWWRVRWWDVTLVTGCLAAYVVALALGIGDASGVPGVAIVGAVWWTALGLVAATVLGRRLAWVVPVVVMVAMLWFGKPSEPLWWAVPFHRVTVLKVALAVVVYAAAAGLYLWAAHRPITRRTRWWIRASAG